MAEGPTLRVKRGIASSIGTLSAGELGWTTDTHILYVGDGATNYPVLMLSGGTLTGFLTTADHGTASTPQVVSVVYGTGSPPTASSTPEGTLFMQYTA